MTHSLTHSVLSVRSDYLGYLLCCNCSLSGAWRAVHLPLCSLLDCCSASIIFSQQGVLCCFPVSFLHCEYQVQCYVFTICLDRMHCCGLTHLMRYGLVILGEVGVWTQYVMDHILLPSCHTSDNLRRWSTHKMQHYSCNGTTDSALTSVLSN